LLSSAINATAAAASCDRLIAALAACDTDLELAAVQSVLLQQQQALQEASPTLKYHPSKKRLGKPSQ
jgi:hypothetical protein